MTTKHILLFAALVPAALIAQDKYGTRSGHISFHSSTPVEDIEAHNHKVSAVFDPATNAIQFAVVIKAFEFEKALMQEHFNENYMESNTYPKAEFKGKVSGFGAEQLRKGGGTHTVQVAGDLTIHGVTKPVSHAGSIVINADGSLKCTSEFIVKPEDHGIKIPGMVRKNIAEEITVKVDATLTKL
jgi:hypothetical protein